MIVIVHVPMLSASTHIVALAVSWWIIAVPWVVFSHPVAIENAAPSLQRIKATKGRGGTELVHSHETVLPVKIVISSLLIGGYSFPTPVITKGSGSVLVRSAVVVAGGALTY